MTPNLALRAVLPWLAAMALLLAPCHAGADERIGVMAAGLEQSKDGPSDAIVLNATFEFELPQALEIVEVLAVAEQGAVHAEFAAPAEEADLQRQSFAGMLTATHA